MVPCAALAKTGARRNYCFATLRARRRSPSTKHPSIGRAEARTVTCSSFRSPERTFARDRGWRWAQTPLDRLTARPLGTPGAQALRPAKSDAHGSRHPGPSCQRTALPEQPIAITVMVDCVFPRGQIKRLHWHLRTLGPPDIWRWFASRAERDLGARARIACLDRPAARLGRCTLSASSARSPAGRPIPSTCSDTRTGNPRSYGTPVASARNPPPTRRFAFRAITPSLALARSRSFGANFSLIHTHVPCASP